MTIQARKIGRPSSFHQGLDRLDQAMTRFDAWRLPSSLTDEERTMLMTIWTDLTAAQDFFARANTAKGRLA